MSWPLALVACVGLLGALHSLDMWIAVAKVPYIKIKHGEAEFVGRGEKAVAYLIERSEISPPDFVRSRARQAAAAHKN